MKPLYCYPIDPLNDIYLNDIKELIQRLLTQNYGKVVNIGSTHAIQWGLLEKELYGKACIVRLLAKDPHPGPAEVADQAGQGSDLEGIAGHGAHEHGKLCLLAQTAAGGKVAHLVEGQTEDYFFIKIVQAFK